MARRGRGFRVVAIVMALSSNACYTYGGRGVAANLPPDRRVGAWLTTRASVNHESSIGPDVERVEGIVARATGDSVSLRVLRTRTRNGDWTTWSGEPVSFGMNDFASIGERRLSRARTAIAVGALTAVIVMAITTDLFGFGGLLGGSDPRPIPPQNPG